MYIYIKNRPNVLHTYLGTDYKCISDNSEKCVPVPDYRLFTPMKYEHYLNGFTLVFQQGGTAANYLTVRVDILLRE